LLILIQNVLAEIVIKPNRSQLWFQLDGALAHRAKIVTFWSHFVCVNVDVLIIDKQDLMI